jgi:hypothetical protein
MIVVLFEVLWGRTTRYVAVSVIRNNDEHGVYAPGLKALVPSFRTISQYLRPPFGEYGSRMLPRSPLRILCAGTSVRSVRSRFS